MSRSLSQGAAPVTKACARTTLRVAGRAPGEIRAHPVHGGAEHRRVVGPLGAELLAGEGGFEVRQSVDGDLAVLVGQYDGPVAGRGVGAQVDAGPAHESGADAEPPGRVVVAGDHHGGDAEVGEAVQRVVEELDGAERGTARS